MDTNAITLKTSTSAQHVNDQKRRPPKESFCEFDIVENYQRNKQHRRKKGAPSDLTRKIDAFTARNAEIEAMYGAKHASDSTNCDRNAPIKQVSSGDSNSENRNRDDKVSEEDRNCKRHGRKHSKRRHRRSRDQESKSEEGSELLQKKVITVYENVNATDFSESVISKDCPQVGGSSGCGKQEVKSDKSCVVIVQEVKSKGCLAKTEDFPACKKSVKKEKNRKSKIYSDEAGRHRKDEFKEYLHNLTKSCKLRKDAENKKKHALFTKNVRTLYDASKDPSVDSSNDSINSKKLSENTPGCVTKKRSSSVSKPQEVKNLIELTADESLKKLLEIYKSEQERLPRGIYDRKEFRTTINIMRDPEVKPKKVGRKELSFSNLNLAPVRGLYSNFDETRPVMTQTSKLNTDLGSGQISQTALALRDIYKVAELEKVRSLTRRKHARRRSVAIVTKHELKSKKVKNIAQNNKFHTSKTVMPNERIVEISSKILKDDKVSFTVEGVEPARRLEGETGTNQPPKLLQLKRQTFPGIDVNLGDVRSLNHGGFKNNSIDSLEIGGLNTFTNTETPSPLSSPRGKRSFNLFCIRKESARRKAVSLRKSERRLEFFHNKSFFVQQQNLQRFAVVDSTTQTTVRSCREIQFHDGDGCKDAATETAKRENEFSGFTQDVRLVILGQGESGSKDVSVESLCSANSKKSSRSEERNPELSKIAVRNNRSKSVCSSAYQDLFLSDARNPKETPGEDSYSSYNGKSTRGSALARSSKIPIQNRPRGQRSHSVSSEVRNYGLKPKQNAPARSRSCMRKDPRSEDSITQNQVTSKSLTSVDKGSYKSIFELSNCVLETSVCSTRSVSRRNSECAARDLRRDEDGTRWNDKTEEYSSKFRQNQKISNNQDSASSSKHGTTKEGRKSSNRRGEDYTRPKVLYSSSPTGEDFADSSRQEALYTSSNDIADYTRQKVLYSSSPTGDDIAPLNKDEGLISPSPRREDIATTAKHNMRFPPNLKKVDIAGLAAQERRNSSSPKRETLVAITRQQERCSSSPKREGISDKDHKSLSPQRDTIEDLTRHEGRYSSKPKREIFADINRQEGRIPSNQKRDSKQQRSYSSSPKREDLDRRAGRNSSSPKREAIARLWKQQGSREVILDCTKQQRSCSSSPKREDLTRRVERNTSSPKREGIANLCKQQESNSLSHEAVVECTRLQPNCSSSPKCDDVTRQTERNSSNPKRETITKEQSSYSTSPKREGIEDLDRRKGRNSSSPKGVAADHFTKQKGHDSTSSKCEVIAEPKRRKGHDSSSLKPDAIEDFTDQKGNSARPKWEGNNCRSRMSSSSPTAEDFTVTKYNPTQTVSQDDYSASSEDLGVECDETSLTESTSLRPKREDHAGNKYINSRMVKLDRGSSSNRKGEDIEAKQHHKKLKDRKELFSKTRLMKPTRGSSSSPKRGAFEDKKLFIKSSRGVSSSPKRETLEATNSREGKQDLKPKRATLKAERTSVSESRDGSKRRCQVHGSSSDLKLDNTNAKRETLEGAKRGKHRTSNSKREHVVVEKRRRSEGRTADLQSVITDTKGKAFLAETCRRSSGSQGSSSDLKFAITRNTKRAAKKPNVEVTDEREDSDGMINCHRKEIQALEKCLNDILQKLSKDDKKECEDKAIRKQDDLKLGSDQCKNGNEVLKEASADKKQKFSRLRNFAEAHGVAHVYQNLDGYISSSTNLSSKRSQDSGSSYPKSIPSLELGLSTIQNITCYESLESMRRFKEQLVINGLNAKVAKHNSSENIKITGGSDEHFTVKEKEVMTVGGSSENLLGGKHHRNYDDGIRTKKGALLMGQSKDDKVVKGRFKGKSKDKLLSTERKVIAKARRKHALDDVKKVLKVKNLSITQMAAESFSNIVFLSVSSTCTSPSMKPNYESLIVDPDSTETLSLFLRKNSHRKQNHLPRDSGLICKEPFYIRDQDSGSKGSTDSLETVPCDIDLCPLTAIFNFSPPSYAYHVYNAAAIPHTKQKRASNLVNDDDDVDETSGVERVRVNNDVSNSDVAATDAPNDIVPQAPMVLNGNIASGPTKTWTDPTIIPNETFNAMVMGRSNGSRDELPTFENVWETNHDWNIVHDPACETPGLMKTCPMNEPKISNETSQFYETTNTCNPQVNYNQGDDGLKPFPDFEFKSVYETNNETPLRRIWKEHAAEHVNFSHESVPHFINDPVVYETHWVTNVFNKSVDETPTRTWGYAGNNVLPTQRKSTNALNPHKGNVDAPKLLTTWGNNECPPPKQNSSIFDPLKPKYTRSPVLIGSGFAQAEKPKLSKLANASKLECKNIKFNYLTKTNTPIVSKQQLAPIKQVNTSPFLSDTPSGCNLSTSSSTMRDILTSNESGYESSKPTRTSSIKNFFKRGGSLLELFKNTKKKKSRPKRQKSSESSFTLQMIEEDTSAASYSSVETNPSKTVLWFNFGKKKSPKKDASTSPEQRADSAICKLTCRKKSQQSDTPVCTGTSTCRLLKKCTCLTDMERQKLECKQYAEKVLMEAALRKEGYRKQYTDFKEIPLNVLMGKKMQSPGKRRCKECTPRATQVTPTASKQLLQEGASIVEIKPLEEGKTSVNMSSLLKFRPGLQDSQEARLSKLSIASQLSLQENRLTDKEVFDRLLENFEKKSSIADRLSQDDEFFNAALSGENQVGEDRSNLSVRIQESAQMLDEAGKYRGPRFVDRSVVESQKIDCSVNAEDIGTCFARGFRPDNLMLSGDACFNLNKQDKIRMSPVMLTDKESIIDFSERETPLDFLLALGFMVDEASNALKDDDIRSRLLAAITEARVWINKITTTQGTLLYLVAYKARPETMRYFLQLVEAIINKRISNAIKLDGFLRVLEQVEDGRIQMVTILGEDKFEDEDNEEKILKKQLKHLFVNVYSIAEQEAKELKKELNPMQIDLLRILVGKYRAGLHPHLELIARYIGQGLLDSQVQLEAAMIFLSRLDTADVKLKEFENYCGIRCEKK